jgi:hypothetical protein
MLAAGVRVATGLASGVGQVKGDDPDPWSSRLGRQANKLTSVKKYLIVEKPNNRSPTDNIGKDQGKVLIYR